MDSNTQIMNELSKINEKMDILMKIVKEIQDKPKKQTKENKKENNKKETIVKSGHLTIDKYKEKIKIGGHTFDVKNILKKYKAMWENSSKTWIIKIEHFDTVYDELKKYCLSIKIFDKQLESDSSIGSNKSEENNIDNTNNLVFEFLDDE